MVRLGVIGLGSAWHKRYWSALEQLSQRASPVAIFDPVFTKAEREADDLGIEAGTGLLATARRCDVDALLLLETGWYGIEALRLLCATNKPVYIAADLGDDTATLQALHWTAMSYGLTLMPEFPLRYTPASSRLQELIATRLGPPTRVRVDLASPEFADGCLTEGRKRRLLHWFDWLRYVARGWPRSIAVTESGDEMMIAVEFTRTIGPLTTELRLRPGTGEPVETPEIECRNGRATIESPAVIRWETTEAFETETLTADRNETEVMLDHFCRRVVGGLIPVADLSDISHALAMQAAAEASQTEGRPISLPTLDESAA